MKKINHKNIFLIDGIGAIITATLLFFILMNFQGFFGVPWYILYLFAGFATLLAAYSLTIHFVSRFTRRIRFRETLLLVAVFNFFYCISTAYVMFQLKGITSWGLAYFIGEIAIIMGLVFIELRIAKRGF